jgi:hypothetical protein
MSQRTVGRAILEGGVAAKLQLGYEWSRTPGMTLSADSMSHLKMNIESRHTAHRVPDYQSPGLDIDPDSVIHVCLLCVDKTLDHSSQTSFDGWKHEVEDIVELVKRSPLGQRLNQKFTVQDFL